MIHTLLLFALTAPPPTPSDVRVACGDDVACAATSLGVWCWGEGNDGELGDGTFDARGTTARRVRGLAAVVDLSVGDDLVCVARRDGRVACWGEGFGRQPSSAVPRVVGGIEDAVGVAAIDRSACALTRAGTVHCWGGAAPQKIPGIDDAVRLAARRVHGCAQSKSGDVRCWDFERARFGSLRPQVRDWAHGARWIALNEGGLCSAHADEVRCGLALGESAAVSTPMASPIVVDQSDQDACAVLADGAVRCVGPHVAPAAEGPQWLRIAPLPQAGTVAVGEGFACVAARGEQGASNKAPAPNRFGDGGPGVWCWGAGDAGQLGDGRAKTSALPVRVLGIGEKTR